MEELLKIFAALVFIIVMFAVVGVISNHNAYGGNFTSTPSLNHSVIRF